MVAAVVAAVGVVAVVLVSVPQAHSSMLPSASVGLVAAPRVVAAVEVWVRLVPLSLFLWLVDPPV